MQLPVTRCLFTTTVALVENGSKPREFVAAGFLVSNMRLCQSKDPFPTASEQVYRRTRNSFSSFAPSVTRYFSSTRWFRQVPLPLANATEAGWAELQHIEDQVLAVSALFGMFQVKRAAKTVFSAPCLVLCSSSVPRISSLGYATCDTWHFKLRSEIGFISFRCADVMFRSNLAVPNLSACCQTSVPMPSHIVHTSNAVPD